MGRNQIVRKEGADGTAITGTSTGGAQANTVTLTSAAGSLAFCSGFEITGMGATVGVGLAVTLSGVLGGTLQYVFGVPAGATVAAVPLVVQFDPPLPASGVNTNIVLTVPSFGAGNTAAAATIHGYLNAA